MTSFAACPERIPLSVEELNKLRKLIKRDKQMLWVAMPLSLFAPLLFLYAIQDWTDGSGDSFWGLAAKGLFIAGFLALQLLLWSKRRHRYRLDLQAGIKLSGIAEVAERHYSHADDTPNAHYIRLYWKSGKNDPPVELDDREMYHGLRVGDRILLEMLPNSYKLLSWHKVER